MLTAYLVGIWLAEENLVYHKESAENQFDLHATWNSIPYRNQLNNGWMDWRNR